jgi:hypothetical protein
LPGTEAEFLDVIGTKVLRVFLLAIHSHLYQRIYSLSLIINGLKLVCNVNIVYGNLKYDNSQDNAQKPQLNCAFMNAASTVRHRQGANHKDKHYAQAMTKLSAERKKGI